MYICTQNYISDTTTGSGANKRTLGRLKRIISGPNIVKWWLLHWLSESGLWFESSKKHIYWNPWGVIGNELIKSVACVRLDKHTPRHTHHASLAHPMTIWGYTHIRIRNMNVTTSHDTRQSTEALLSRKGGAWCSSRLRCPHCQRCRSCIRVNCHTVVVHTHVSSPRTTFLWEQRFCTACIHEFHTQSRLGARRQGTLAPSCRSHRGRVRRRV